MSSTGLKYRKPLKKHLKMTCIIGAKCKEGVVLVTDWKVISDNESVEFKKKIFMDYYHVVVVSSGSTTQFGNLRREAKEAAQRFFGQSPNQVSGAFSVYPDAVTLPTITLYSYLDDLKEIVKKYKKEANAYPFDALVAIQTKDRGARLHYIDAYGAMGDHEDYIIVGSDTSRIISLVFLKPIWNRDIPMSRFLRDAFFIIKFIDRFHLDDTVGLGGNMPQIPDSGQVQEVPPISLKGINQTVDKMLDNWEESGLDRLDTAALNKSKT